jgi:hypothetical protein
MAHNHFIPFHKILSFTIAIQLKPKVEIKKKRIQSEKMFPDKSAFFEVKMKYEKMRAIGKPQAS